MGHSTPHAHGPQPTRLFLTEFDCSIRKGESVMVPIVVLNRLPQVWGPDSHTFKYVDVHPVKNFRELSDMAGSPQRWLGAENPTTAALPGIWANLMSFLGGPRSCIGYKFALTEYVVDSPASLPWLTLRIYLLG